MGLVQDAAVLAASGYSKTSGALTLIAKLGGETENLVCASCFLLLVFLRVPDDALLPGDEIQAALGKLAAAWWDQPEADREAISKFRRTLFGPVADRLGELLVLLAFGGPSNAVSGARIRVRRGRRCRHD